MPPLELVRGVRTSKAGNRQSVHSFDRSFPSLSKSLPTVTIPLSTASSGEERPASTTPCSFLAYLLPSSLVVKQQILPFSRCNCTLSSYFNPRLVYYLVDSASLCPFRRSSRPETQPTSCLTHPGLAPLRPRYSQVFDPPTDPTHPGRDALGDRQRPWRRLASPHPKPKPPPSTTQRPSSAPSRQLQACPASQV